MNRVMFDSSAYSALQRGHGGVLRALQNAEVICVNPVVLGELCSGFRTGGRRAGGDRARPALGRRSHPDQRPVDCGHGHAARPAGAHPGRCRWAGGGTYASVPALGRPLCEPPWQRGAADVLPSMPGRDVRQPGVRPLYPVRNQNWRRWREGGHGPIRRAVDVNPANAGHIPVAELPELPAAALELDNAQRPERVTADRWTVPDANRVSAVFAK